MVKITLVTNNPRQSFIVPGTKTVKEILEEKDINYANAAISVDGATLSVGEINRTLDELGCVDKVIISVLADKDNAAKAEINGSACIVTSQLTPEQIIRVQKMHPEGLVLYDEEEEVFAICYEPGVPGSLTTYGATFGDVVDADGHATITILLDSSAGADPEETVYNELGRSLMLLDELEAGILRIMPELDEEERKIRDKITRR